jgi:hypothetical protein
MKMLQSAQRVVDPYALTSWTTSEIGMYASSNRGPHPENDANA